MQNSFNFKNKKKVKKEIIKFIDLIQIISFFKIIIY